MANFLSTLPKAGLLGVLGDKIEEDKEEERRKQMLMEQSMGMKCGGKVKAKKFAKGGSVDDLAPRSNLPDKNAMEQARDAKKKQAPREKYNDLAPRESLPTKKYAKGGAVRGDGCCVSGKTKGRFR